MTTVYHGKIVLPDRVLGSGYITIEDGVITCIGEEAPEGCTPVETEGFVAPGFVDIHCHDCPIVSGYEDPVKVADYHYQRGATSMLLTLYRGQTHEKYLSLIEQVKQALPEMKNLRGLHFEGPYLNGKYGAQSREQDYPKKEEYMEYLASGLFRQWTCSPEVEGTMELIRDVKLHGVVPAIGHSEASYQQVKDAVTAGAGIVTHIFDATGTTTLPDSFRGTLDVSFNEAAMLFSDSLYYEVICDREWVHVRKEKLALLEKTVGIDKIVAITDCCCGSADDGRDINVVGGELMGSKLTMMGVAQNLHKAGYTMPEIAKMTARNPARAIAMTERGEIAVGQKADLILVDDEYTFIRHLQ